MAAKGRLWKIKKGRRSGSYRSAGTEPAWLLPSMSHRQLNATSSTYFKSIEPYYTPDDKFDGGLQRREHSGAGCFGKWRPGSDQSHSGETIGHRAFCKRIAAACRVGYFVTPNRRRAGHTAAPVLATLIGSPPLHQDGLTTAGGGHTRWPPSMWTSDPLR